MPEGKRSYNDVLRNRIERQFGDVVDVETCDAIYNFVKAEALQSWKNGLSVGRTRASNGAPKASIKGGALANGKLHRADRERELVVEVDEE